MTRCHCHSAQQITYKSCLSFTSYSVDCTSNYKWHYMHVANTIVNKPYSFVKSIPHKDMHLDLLRNEEEIWIQYLEDTD